MWYADVADQDCRQAVQHARHCARHQQRTVHCTETRLTHKHAAETLQELMAPDDTHCTHTPQSESLADSQLSHFEWARTQSRALRSPEQVNSSRRVDSWQDCVWQSHLDHS